MGFSRDRSTDPAATNRGNAPDSPRGDMPRGDAPRGDAPGADAERGEPGSADAYGRGAAGADRPQELADQLAEADGGATSPPGDLAGEAQRALDEQHDKYLRLAAEYDNYRRRTTRERQEAGTRAQGDLVRQMIDALDDLARFAHVDPATVDPATIVQGVDMVEKKLMKALGGVGLQVVNPVDQAFDPAMHEALGTEPALSREDDHLVARVYQPGYVFNGQLLRPARVAVKQWNG
jgi:molecular chaperone GrpE